jgi:lipoate-protein ligase A
VPTTWRRLRPGQVTAEAALERGIELLHTARPGEPPTGVWWQTGAEALVLGRGARVDADERACRAAGVSIVRRSSGGGPVLWGPDLLALDVIVPREHPLAPEDVVASYRWLGEAIARGLAELGIAGHALTPDEARSHTTAFADQACFAAFSPWEVIVDGRKAVGLSQVRRRPGILLQAGILMRADPGRLPSLLALSPAERAALDAAIGDSAIGLDEITPDVDADHVMAAVEVAISEALGGD